jgi:hypothetical protein
MTDKILSQIRHVKTNIINLESDSEDSDLKKDNPDDTIESEDLSLSSNLQQEEDRRGSLV